MKAIDYPALAKEWDKEANDAIGLDFESIAAGSNKEAHWICDKGHKFSRRVYERATRGYGCPYCSGRQILPGFNDFATKNPELLKEWDYEKNKKLGIDPTTIGVGFRPKVWWICPKGHSYDSVIYPRTTGCGCPYCSTPPKKILAGFNDLATTNPELVTEWDFKKNTLKPTDVSYGNTKNFWWICPKGHSYSTAIANRTKAKTGCPYCIGQKAIAGINDLFTKYPELEKEWDFEKNTVDPSTIVRGGATKFWWKCKRGHEWQSRVTDRIRNDNTINQCPTCARRNRISFPEKIIYYYVKKAFPDAAENYRSDWLGKKELDIYIPSLNVGIEYDGEYFHKAERDLAKDNLCNKHGVKLIRIREKNAKTIDSNSIIYQITDNGRADGKHLAGALHFLEKELGVNLDADLNRDHDTLRTLVEKYEVENCIAKTNPELLSEWDYEKNAQLGLTPENVSRGTSGTVWWICSKGHSYDATLSNRINGGTGCPFCSTPPRKILAGFNDLATTNPELAKRWDYSKNKFKPTEITQFANKHIWLICDKGHSYDGSLINLGKAFGCPYCSGHRILAGYNDLVTTHPSLADEWDYDLNHLTPAQVGKGHCKQVWWKCKNGHSYPATPNQRVSKGSGCPYCSTPVKKVLAGFNDLATTNPELLLIWDYSKNKIKPTEISKGSGKTVYLICDKGHSYPTTIPNYLKGSRCTYCGGSRVLKGFNDIATTDPELLKVWNDDKYSPYELSRKSGRTISCHCPSCGHSWSTKVYNLTNRKKCPGCKKSLSEL